MDAIVERPSVKRVAVEEQKRGIFARLASSLRPPPKSLETAKYPDPEADKRLFRPNYRNSIVMKYSLLGSHRETGAAERAFIEAQNHIKEASTEVFGHIAIAKPEDQRMDIKPFVLWEKVTGMLFITNSRTQELFKKTLNSLNKAMLLAEKEKNLFLFVQVTEYAASFAKKIGHTKEFEMYLSASIRASKQLVDEARARGDPDTAKVWEEHASNIQASTTTGINV